MDTTIVSMPGSRTVKASLLPYSVVRAITDLSRLKKKKSTPLLSRKRDKDAAIRVAAITMSSYNCANTDQIPREALHRECALRAHEWTSSVEPRSF